MNNLLTKRQEEILNFIKKYNIEFGIMPAIRDISSEFCMNPKGALDHLLALERKGKIVRNGKARSIHINEKEYKININHEVLINFKKLSKTNRIMLSKPKGIICCICKSKENIHRHHENYDKPEEYIELCRKHHILWHQFKRNFAKAGLTVQLLPSIV